jgi:GNAT superfamily N-acetyltransferase
VIDEREVLARWAASHRAFHRLFAGGSPGAEVVERDDGILALACPARPERSLVNGVVYREASALPPALPELADFYERRGIQAWTVWVHAGDEQAAEACRAAGHVLDATPELMWAPIDGLDLDPGAIDFDDVPSWKVVGDINDVAYGLPRDHLSVTLQGADPVHGVRTVARIDGRPVATATANVVGRDAHILLVATIPEARGHGLAAACMRRVLRRAAARGATTTTLEATQMGRPVYERLGYRSLGTLGMWERRRG